MKDYERCIILPFDKNSLNFTDDEELNYAYLEQTIKYINELLKSDDCKGLYLNDLCEIFAIPIKHTYIEYGIRKGTKFDPRIKPGWVLIDEDKGEVWDYIDLEFVVEPVIERGLDFVKWLVK